MAETKDKKSPTRKTKGVARGDPETELSKED
jgi:hypothetical protein